jgi:LysR family transcriptional activator of glutamate synthase operon
MEIRQIQYFLSIVESNGFSLAADSLYISQSSLSKHVIALERELGFQVFDRSKRQVSLTQAGQAFRKHAESIYSDYQRMLEEIQEYRTARARLLIVAIPVIAPYGLTGCIAQYKSLNPDVALTLEEREASFIVQALADHQFDLAFIRDNYLDREKFACLEICPDHLTAVVSTQHRLASRPAVALKELASENFVMFDRGTVVHELTVEACRGAGFEPRIYYTSLRAESIVSLVASNVGVALIMKRVADYHRHPGTVAIPLEEEITSHLVLAYPKNRKLSGPAKRFLDLAARLAPVC